MKALSIKQPWAWLILHAGKDVENRTWPTKYRGPVLIHASRILDKRALRELEDVAMDPHSSNDAAEKWLKGARQAPRGCLVGVATIVDCVKYSSSPWFGGPYGFVLEDVMSLPEPIPYRGTLGLFNVPDELVPSEMISDMSLRGV